MKLELVKKKVFVSKIKEAVIPVQPNIVDMEYKIYRKVDSEERVEYLIINYKGGARTVRVCTGNSCSAIFEEISKYLNRGYYDEERFYSSKIESNTNWIEEEF